MPKTKYLSDKEKRIGQKHMYRQEVFNGISFSLMGETVVYLLALYFGAGNFALGYISSVIFLAGIILPVVPRMLKASHQGTLWRFRGRGPGPPTCYRQWRLGSIFVVVYTLYNLYDDRLNDSTEMDQQPQSGQGRSEYERRIKARDDGPPRS